MENIIKYISQRFENNDVYNQNIEFFAAHCYDFNELAMSYIGYATKCHPIQRLMELSPQYIEENNLYSNQESLLFEENIDKFLKLEIDRLDIEENFVQDFLSYLKSHKPDIFEILKKIIDDGICKLNEQYNRLTNFQEKCPKPILRKMARNIVGHIGAIEVFYIMTEQDINILKDSLSSLKEAFLNQELEILKQKQIIENLKPKNKSQPITRKENLIKLLNFCDDCLKKDQNATPQKIIEQFEDEFKYCGGWKTWEKFFIDNYETIKNLTGLESGKKIYSCFSLKDNRDKIDKLYSVIDFKR